MNRHPPLSPRGGEGAGDLAEEAKTPHPQPPSPEGRGGPSVWLVDNPAPTPYTRVSFSDGDVLLFGSESKGLPPGLKEKYAERHLGIPMPNNAVRSLNLATAVGIVLYEALRQVHGW